MYEHSLCSSALIRRRKRRSATETAATSTTTTQGLPTQTVLCKHKFALLVKLRSMLQPHYRFQHRNV